MNPEQYLHTRVNVFLQALDDLKAAGSAFGHVFPHLATSSVLFTSDEWKKVLDEKAGDIATPIPGLAEDEEVCDLLLNLIPPRSGELRSAPQTQKKDVDKHWMQQFGRPFIGDARTRFLRFVLAVRSHFNGQPGRKMYYKGTSIVQSSGTGKTRMVLELSNYAPLLYLCFPSSSTHHADAVPPSDAGVAEYFESTHGRDGDLGVAAFLGGWFAELAAGLAECKDDAEAKQNVLVGLQRYGNNTKETMQRRNEFFTRVCSTAAKIVASLPDDDSKDRVGIFRHCLAASVKALGEQLSTVRDHLWGQLSEDERERILGPETDEAYTS